MVKYDMVDFAEKICGCKLTVWQKEFIRRYEEFRKEHPHAKLICGRDGRIYFVDEKGEKHET